MNKLENTALLILDGWGHGSDPKVSAIAQANTPFISGLYNKYPNSEEAKKSIFMIAYIYNNSLNAYTDAIEYYNLFINKYPMIDILVPADIYFNKDVDQINWNKNAGDMVGMNEVIVELIINKQSINIKESLQNFVNIKTFFSDFCTL